MKNKKQIMVGATIFGVGLLVGVGVRGPISSQLPVIEVSPVSVPVIEKSGEVIHSMEAKTTDKEVESIMNEVEPAQKTRTWNDLDITAEERVELEKIMKSRGESVPPPQEWVEHVYRGKIKKARAVSNI